MPTLLPMSGVGGCLQQKTCILAFVSLKIVVHYSLTRSALQMLSVVSY